MIVEELDQLATQDDANVAEEPAAHLQRPKRRLLFSASDAEERSARFGRSSFLKLVGGSVFGTAAAMAVKSSPAYAVACSSSGPPSPCYGFPRCNCCSRTSCCAAGCLRLNGHCPATNDGYTDGANYWSACSGGYLFNCADFCQTCTGGLGPSCGGGKRACICRFYIGTC